MKQMTKNKSKKKSGNSNSAKHLQKCKHCQQKLYASDISVSKKRYQEEIPGIWGGYEKPYSQEHSVNCSNQKCNKSYTITVKKSDWFYK